MVGRFRLKSGDSLVVATHNQGKLREFRDLFDPLGVAVASSGELGVAEPEETGETFEENARLKAVATAAETGRLALSDDSGLAIEALGGAPGIHSARWAGEPRDFYRAMSEVESRLQAMGAVAPRAASGEVRLHALPCKFGRGCPVLRRDRSGSSCLAASREEGLRLRSHICTRWV